jgi:long-chain acyl-CoA synthetase
VSLSQKIWQHAKDNRRAKFLSIGDSQFSYGDLLERINFLVELFEQRNAQEGDRVLIAMSSDSDAIFAFMAALLDGLVPVMLSPNSKPIKFKSIFEQVEPRLSFVDAQFSDAVGKSLATIPSPTKNLLSTIGIGRKKFTREPRLPNAGDQLAYILFTSGTTQAPKGVMISHDNLAANLGTISKVLEITQKSKIFNDLEIRHADGLVQGPLLSAFNGAHCVRYGGFHLENLESWLNTVKRQNVTHCIAVPTIWSIVDRMAQFDDYFVADDFKYLVSAADKLPAQLWEQIERRFNRPLISQYGLTETVTSALYCKQHRQYNLGFPIDCEAMVADPDQRGEGELYLRGKNIFRGYWNDHDLTNASVQDGWLKTGDLAAKQDDGSYRFCGRRKNVLMFGGRLIHPEEVEEIALQHPLIHEAILVGVEDDQFGEVGVLIVNAEQSLSEGQIYDHMELALEPALIPKKVVFVEEFPKNEAGKISRAEILQMVFSRHEVMAEGDAVANNVEGKVLELIATYFRIEQNEINLAATADDIAAWDSFSSLNLIMAIEQSLEIKLRAKQVARIKSLNDFVIEAQNSAGE